MSQPLGTKESTPSSTIAGILSQWNVEDDAYPLPPPVVGQDRVFHQLKRDVATMAENIDPTWPRILKRRSRVVQVIAIKLTVLMRPLIRLFFARQIRFNEVSASMAYHIIYMEKRLRELEKEVKQLETTR